MRTKGTKIKRRWISLSTLFEYHYLQLMQQRSAYPFGTAIKLDKFNVPEYQFFTDFVLKHFNWAVIANKLKWYGIERIQVSFIKRSLVGEEKWNRFYLCWHCIRTYFPVPNRSVNICTCMVIGLNLNNNIPLQDQSDYTSVLAALDVLEANGYELVFYIHVKTGIN